jgi:hypothetical protein
MHREGTRHQIWTRLAEDSEHANTGNTLMSMATIHTASAARVVLSRAEYMLTELRDDPRGVAWEAKFSASVALLRSIGHVLEKTDKKVARN